MASGVTNEMIRFSRRYLHKRGNGCSQRVLVQSVKPSDRTPRDRTLRGKERITARKARNKAGW